MIKKNNKNIKKILILVVMCIIVILIYEIVHIYAIFHSEIEGNVNLKNGVWNIVVNGTQISKGTQTSFVIDEFNIEENNNVKNGKLAPGLTGDFTISINPEDTNVSVKYEITLGQMSQEFFDIKSIEEIEVQNTLIKTGENTYTGIMPLERVQQGEINKIKVDIQWNDDRTHDNEDTSIGAVYNSKLEIPVIVKVSQYLGETIIPYEG